MREALRTVERLTGEAIRRSPGKSTEELADTFIAKHYPGNSDRRVREWYLRRFQAKK
jgi:hypothetical protein